MKQTVPFLWLAAMLALTSCDLFVPPKVACDDITASADLQLKSERAGVGCLFPEALTVRVSHAPRVDQEWAKDNGSPPDTELPNSPVRVTAGSGAITVCGGVDCAPGTASIDTKIDAKGSLTYEVTLGLEALGLMPGPGGTATSTGIAATEIYGPGNQCNVKFDLKTGCTEATTTQ